MDIPKQYTVGMWAIPVVDDDDLTRLILNFSYRLGFAKSVTGNGDDLKLLAALMELHDRRLEANGHSADGAEERE